MTNSKFLGFGYLASVVGLFLYSFTQIDLGLTLSEVSIWQDAEGFFKNIGYFQRPLSSFLFTSIVFLLFTFYFLIIYAVHKKKISKSAIWLLIILTTIILNFSYNAFSYDLFNYIFDAKIVTHYGQNPYFHKALDFPGDPMLGFMHWTHRVFPYGPVWLGLTTPLSFLGLQFFLPTFFLFKTLMSLSFLGTAYFIGKILRKVNPNDEVFGVAFFALNPLVIMESLVSSHNDIVMVFLAMQALYLLMTKKYVRSLIMLTLSVGIKFATALLIPVILIVYLFQKKEKSIDWKKVFSAIAIIMIIPIILASVRTNFQPWYLLYFLPFASLVAKKYYFLIPSITISLFSSLQYLPFLYTGNWDRPIPTILFWMTTSSVILSSILVAGMFYAKRMYKRDKMVE